MLDLLLKRRSIRKYKKQKVDDKIIEDILTAALTSPSGRRDRPCELVVVRDKEILDQLTQAKSRTAYFVKDAAFAIVVIADPAISDLWIEDASIMATVIQLVAQSFNLGSCWGQIRDWKNPEGQCVETLTKDILDIPDRYRVECVLAIGYPDEEKEAHQKENLPWDDVHYDSY